MRIGLVIGAVVALAALGAGAKDLRPIGVFDSGIGGLTVLEKLMEHPGLRGERFTYLGDQANMPYGRYDAAGKADFLRELVVRDAQFVLGSEGHDPAKVVVIACNTATAYGLTRVKAMARPHDADVIGVVNAGVEAALDALRDEVAPYAIGVMATPGTISSGVYERTIRAKLKERLVDVPVEIVNRGGIGLAEAVESRDIGMRECARTNLVAMVEDYRARGGKAPIRAMILGCTHYPYVLDTFDRAFRLLKADPKYAPLIANDLRFIDPAHYTAIACYRALRRQVLLSQDGPTREGERRVKAFISVGRDGPLPDAVKYGRTYGKDDLGTKIVPLTKDVISSEVSAGIGKTCPACHRELGL